MEGTGWRLPQIPCKQCKRQQMSWKGSNPRSRPYEKADSSCDHQSSSSFRTTCERCYTRLQKDADGRLRCPDPECQPPMISFPAIIPIPSVLKPSIPATEPRKARKSQAPLILRTHCRNCRLGDEVCSGSISGPRCERCKIADLECDCKVLRRSCAECMNDRGKVTWKRCAGYHDACDACIEKGIECKEYVREPRKEGAEGKQPQDAVADGTMDVIDGMKAIRAFAACERCLDEKLKCDESLPGCGGCRGKDVECKYRLLTTTFSDFSGRRLEQRSSFLSRVHQENCEENTPDEVAPRRSSIPVACGRCRKSKLRCSGVFPCDRCEKLGLDCIPNPEKPRPEYAAARAKWDEIETENKIEQLEGMMSDLELEGWHLVSHEEIEEYVLMEDGST